MFYGGSRTATVSKMEFFMTIFKAVQQSTIVRNSSIVDAVTVSPRSTSEILFGRKSFLFIEIFYFCFSRFGGKRMGETKK